MSEASSPAIVVDGLQKNYGNLIALKAVSFKVYSGELFALLGPNGAGKTTTIRILTGLTRATAGKAFIEGVSVFEQSIKLKRLIGLVPQATNLDLELTVAENLLIHGLLYHLSPSEIRRRSREVLDYIELSHRAKSKAKTLSGGMRRRLLIARALLHRPKVLFLDEPTVGLDPHIRRRLWSLIKRIQRQGTTVLLTTHYIEEAEFLADRVAFIDLGEIIVCDTPARLMASLGQFAVDFTDESGLKTRYFKDQGQAQKEALRLSARGYSVTIRRVNLEDAFVSLTGRKAA
ncbi:ABC transporter ATP-binding protein [Thermosulfuriphilus sp.]